MISLGTWLLLTHILIISAEYASTKNLLEDHYNTFASIHEVMLKVDY